MFAIGKLPPEILEKIVMEPMQASRVKREDVILRPKTGEDCSAVDLGGEYCILSTDPITGAAKDVGYLAVQINCNDIYSSGAEPMGVLLTVLLPPESEEALLEEMMSGAIRAAEERNIEILGGHTEVTEWAGTEGTAILAKEWEEGLRQYLTEEELQNAQAMKAYLSVGKESEIAFAYGATAMHDATEGGVLGAVWEVAECSGLGVDVFVEKIPVKEETKKICKAMGIDYLGLISSGTMIIAAENGEKLAERLQEEGIAAAVIGKLTESGRYMLVNDMRLPLAQPKSDALYEAKL